MLFWIFRCPLPSISRFLQCNFALLHCVHRGPPMSVAFSEAIAPIDNGMVHARRARFGNIWAMAGLVLAGVVNVLWVAALGYGFSLLVF
jgi:hypothetical protein